VPAKTEVTDFAEFLQGQGFLRIWLYGETLRLDDKDALKGRKLPARVLVVQDRVKLEAASQARLAEAIEAALRYGKGQMSCVFDAVSGSQLQVPGSSSKKAKAAVQAPSSATQNQEPGTKNQELRFSTGWHCAHCDITLPSPTPGLFSFNNPIGACPTCRGFGQDAGTGHAQGDSR